MRYLKAFSLLLVFASVFFLYAQSEEDKDVLLEIQKLEADISDMKKRTEEEKENYEKYKTEIENIIKQKENEKKELNASILSIEKEIYEEKSKLRHTVAKKIKIENKFKNLSRLIEDIILGYEKHIERSIPFEKDKRLAALKTLQTDISSGRGTFEEYFNRLKDFLNTEERLAYDCEVIVTIVNVSGKNVEAEVLRVGRVFFAAATSERVYLYKETDAGFVLDSENALSLNREKSIRDAIKMIQGNKAPEFVELPLNSKRFEVEND